MKVSWIVMILGVLVLSLEAQAGQQSVDCENVLSAQDCQSRIESTLNPIGCQVDGKSFKCQRTLNEDGTPSTSGVTVFCDFTSANCSNPRTGIGSDICDTGQMVAYSAALGVNNGYWYGFLGSYSRNVCLEK